jgi:hypothetical protein
MEHKDGFCEWVYSEDTQEYFPVCDAEYSLMMEGSPMENKYKFCHLCGNPIIVVDYHDAI